MVGFFVCHSLVLFEKSFSELSENYRKAIDFVKEI